MLWLPHDNQHEFGAPLVRQHPCPALLFHYCPIPAFEAIVGRGRVWLSDAARMNDLTEGTWLDQVVERVREHPDPEWNEIGHVVHDYRLSRRTFFIGSLSERGDLLSQWRAYADDGRGVSIGLSLVDLALPEGLSFDDVFVSRGLSTHIDRVVYDPDEQGETLRAVFRRISAAMTLADASTSVYLRDGILDTSADALAYLARLFKHPGFIDEKEWRIVVSGKNDHPLHPSVLPERLTRRRGDVDIDYHEIDLRFGSGLVRHVIAGPKCPLSDDQLGALLRAAGWPSVTTSRSTIPYR